METTPSLLQKRVGWALTGLVGAFIIVVSASGKFITPAPPMVAETSVKLGWPLAGYPALGALEVSVTVLSMIPRTAFVGLILLSAYLGGACAAHVRIGDPSAAMPVVLAVLAWGLRHPDRLRAALGRGVA